MIMTSLKLQIAVGFGFITHNLTCYALQLVMLVLILIFAGVHSGLASFRDTGEKLIGERAFRVLFAATSLPLALTTIVSSYSFLYPH